MRKPVAQVDAEIVDYLRSFTPVRSAPLVVCLCGSTRFGEQYRAANLERTLAGEIVLSIGCDMRADAEIFAGFTPAELAKVKTDLDELHKRKIDLADYVYVLNVGGYIGTSTKGEVRYARKHGKPVIYLEPPLPRLERTDGTR